MIVRDDEKVKKTIAENIVRYRRECNLTQAELAEKIHYSDKSVSKWERADGVPDIFVLVMLAELFGVTVNDLLTEKHRKSHRAAPKLKRSIITLMSAGLVWLVAAVVFFRIQSRLSRPSANLACIHLCNPRDVHRNARAVRALAPADFQLSVRLRNRLGCCTFG